LDFHNIAIVIPDEQSPKPDDGPILWEEFQAGYDPQKPLDFAQLPFEHPLFILFSSGTTGKPKCIVHSSGGTLIQHLKEHLLHVDIRPRDRFFYYTSCRLYDVELARQRAGKRCNIDFV
jgi:acetoacetyl-CoA synthetase